MCRPEATGDQLEQYCTNHSGGIRRQIARIEAASENELSSRRPAQRIERWKMESLAELDGEAEYERSRPAPDEPRCRRDR